MHKMHNYMGNEWDAFKHLIQLSYLLHSLLSLKLERYELFCKLLLNRYWTSLTGITTALSSECSEGYILLLGVLELWYFHKNILFVKIIMTFYILCCNNKLLSAISRFMFYLMIKIYLPDVRFTK